MPINSFLYPGAKVTTGYEVDNSLRFNDDSTDRLRRTPSSASNRRTFTFSTWVKRSALGSDNRGLITATVDDGNKTMLRFTDSDQLRFVRFTSGGATNQLITNAKFRDVSAWYHIVIAVDTTNSTAGDRLRLYVNGSEITSFSTESQPTQNYDYDINNTKEHNIGYGTDNNNHLFDGYMTEVVFIDGQQLDPTSFGEFDEDTGIWKPIDVSGLTFGTNGFYLDFENSGSLGADVSGNGNNFTVNNLTSIDQSTDTCTNNFATLNPLASGVAIGGVAGTFTDGNLFFSGASSSWCATKGTFSVTQGKWYMEAKKTTNANGTGNGAGAVAVGFAELQSNLPNDNPQNGSSIYGSILAIIDNGWTTNFANGTQWSTPLAVDDGNIVGIALDLDGNNYTFYVNGSQVDTGSLGAGYDGNGLTPCIINYGGDTREFTCNFGSPPYSISSGNTDGNGYGNFEYAVPSGYYALNTKNLAEYG